MSKCVNVMRDFIVFYLWWCVFIVVVMFWILCVGIWMIVGFWLVIIVVCVKYRLLFVVKVSVRVVFLGFLMEFNVGDRVICYDVFGMCYYEVLKFVVGFMVLCVECELQNSYDKNVFKVSVDGSYIGYVFVWVVVDIVLEWDFLGVILMDVYGCVISVFDVYVEILINDVFCGVFI